MDDAKRSWHYPLPNVISLTHNACPVGHYPLHMLNLPFVNRFACFFTYISNTLTQITVQLIMLLKNVAYLGEKKKLNDLTTHSLNVNVLWYIWLVVLKAYCFSDWFREHLFSPDPQQKLNHRASRLLVSARSLDCPGKETLSLNPKWSPSWVQWKNPQWRPWVIKSNVI